MHKLYRQIIHCVFIITALYVTSMQAVVAKGIDSDPVEAVNFYSDKKISFKAPQNNVTRNMMDMVLALSRETHLQFTMSPAETLSDYILELEYGTGCGYFKPPRKCRVMFLWTLFRADGAPVGGWRADYPVQNISEISAIKRFSDVAPNRKIMKQAVDDFLYEILRYTGQLEGRAPLKPNKKKRNPAKVERPKAKKYIYVAKETNAPQNAKCSVKPIRNILKDTGFGVASKIQKANYILRSKTSIQDLGNGYVKIKILRIISLRGKKEPAILPQETVMSKADYIQNGLECEKAFASILPALKEFLTEN
ncbi:MAG: hypothetical protein AAF621_01030 [Pseudomonadota bacterium]